MPNNYVYRRIVSAMADVITLATTKSKQPITLFTTLLITIACVAQNQTPTQASTVTVPAGTQFALVLTNPLSSKDTHRGAMVYAETTAPITVGDQVTIPAGTFIQGKVEKLTRSGTRAEVILTSASLVFPDGYVSNINGPFNVESDEGTAWRDPSNKAKTFAIIAPVAGLGIGVLAGNAAHTTNSTTLGGTTLTSSSPKGIAIGATVGLAAGALVAIAILLNSRHFFVDVGSPMEMTLPQPLILSENRVDDSARWVQQHPGQPIPMAAPRPLPTYNRGSCYTPGTPGTPPTIIPGTPPIGNSPGTPGTFIPGTPGTPGTWYPCR